MPLFPLSKTEATVAIELGGVVIVQDTLGQELGRLDPVAYHVWQLADGVTSVPGIVGAAQARLGRAVETEAVWSALDRLADFGLLAQRITPPAAGGRMPRRGLLSLGIGGTVAAASAPAFAANEEQNQKSAEASYKRTQQQAEQNAKFQNRAAEQNSKASQRGEMESKQGMRQESNNKQQQRQETGNKQAFEQSSKSQQRSQELGYKEANGKRNQAQEQSSKESSKRR